MNLQDMAGVAIMFVVVAIIVAIGTDVLSSMGTDPYGNTTKDNVTRYGNAGILELGSWLPTIAIVVVAAIVIGIIVAYFAMK